jgi:HKD family nuclease
MFLTTKDLLTQFISNLDRSDHVDIATAWVGPSEALEKLLHRVNGGSIKVRIITGLSGFNTAPAALNSILQSNASIRIGTTTIGIYHPKCYIFKSNGKSIGWIGSPNFTFGGFFLNSEIIQQFDLNNNEDYNLEDWFDEQWNALAGQSTDIITDYIENWTRPPRTPSNLPDHVEEVPANLNEINSWDAYVKGLKSRHDIWRSRTAENEKPFSVLDDEWSWFDTISTGHDIALRPNWTNLTRTEQGILLGLEVNDSSGTWGLLGSMRGAGQAVGRFYSDHNLRQAIRTALQGVISATNNINFINACVASISFITNLDGFGPAIATRLIALCRPDMGLSVNAGSAPGLSDLTGLPATAPVLGNVANYPALLNWVYAQNWYKTPAPADPLEQAIWHMRAALVDAFVYKPI